MKDLRFISGCRTPDQKLERLIKVVKMVETAYVLGTKEKCNADNLLAILMCIILRGQFQSPFALSKYIREFKP